MGQRELGCFAPFVFCWTFIMCLPGGMPSEAVAPTKPLPLMVLHLQRGRTAPRFIGRLFSYEQVSGAVKPCLDCSGQRPSAI